MWNFIDGFIGYNILLAHIPGKANAAVDFSSRMQTDPRQSLKLKHVEKMPMKQIEIGMISDTFDALMLAIEVDQTEQVVNEISDL